jgi:hypothetical protein
MIPTTPVDAMFVWKFLTGLYRSLKEIHQVYT